MSTHVPISSLNGTWVNFVISLSLSLDISFIPVKTSANSNWKQIGFAMEFQICHGISLNQHVCLQSFVNISHCSWLNLKLNPALHLISSLVPHLVLIDAYDPIDLFRSDFGSKFHSNFDCESESSAKGFEFHWHWRWRKLYSEMCGSLLIHLRFVELQQSLYCIVIDIVEID